LIEFHSEGESEREIEAVMAGTSGLLNAVKPKIQTIDIQAAAGWGIAAAAGAIWVVQVSYLDLLFSGHRLVFTDYGPDLGSLSLANVMFLVKLLALSG
jgi:hypothetical protein